MRVRCASPADISGIASLVERYWEFESIEGFSRARIESLLQGLLSEPARGACLVAEENGVLQGYLVCVFMLSLEHGGLMAEIDEFFVLPEARCDGLGTLLLQQAERDLAARGLVRWQLQVAVDNRRARVFYERQGFSARAGYALLDQSLRRR